MLFRKTLFALATCAVAVIPYASVAQGLIRDAEIERTLRLVAKPLLTKAGVSPSRAKILVINDKKLNAFVLGGKSNIFVTQGLIRKLKNVEELQAVIAHEIGHITGGHLSQRAAAFEASKGAAGAGLLLGLAVALAGAPDAGAGLALGTSSSAQRGFLSHTRSQEASADQSGVRYMAAAGIDPKAAIEVFKIFEGQNLMSANRRDPYTLTHPIDQDRISNLKGYVGAYKPRASSQPANIDYWYQRTVAKFDGFTGNPAYVLRRLKKSDKSEFATLRRAIAYHRKPSRKLAMSEVAKLIKMRPNDGFYHELHGQFLLENGQTASAIAAYRRAAKLEPNEALILAGLGRALNASKSQSDQKQALKTLQRSYSKDAGDSRMLRELAVAFARAGQKGNASVVTAERYALNGNFKQAAVHAKRAQGLLPSGSSGWLKADAILVVAKRLHKKR